MNEDKTNTAVDRALSILELIAHHESGLSNSDISRRLSIPKSSTSYLLRTMEGRGYLRRDATNGQYRIGLKVLALGQSAVTGLDLGRVARPILMQLVEITRLTAHVAILDHGRAVYIERAENPGFIKMNTWVGRELTIHSTSVGKVLAAHIPVAQLQAILDRFGLQEKTPKTITSRSDFQHELSTIRGRGYAIDDEENNLGVRCVAVPIYGQDGSVRAALGLSGATSQVRRESLDELSRAATEAAANISRQLGYTAPDRRTEEH